MADDERDVRGINDRAQLAAVERVLQARHAQALMMRGATIADPARIDIRGDARLRARRAIDVGCVFEGDVTLADDVSIGPYCVLRDVTVGRGTRVEAFSHLVDATIGAQLPDRTLRAAASRREARRRCPRRQLRRGEGQHAGAGSKANHLAYVGDSAVGSA